MSDTPEPILRVEREISALKERRIQVESQLASINNGIESSYRELAALNSLPRTIQVPSKPADAKDVPPFGEETPDLPRKPSFIRRLYVRIFGGRVIVSESIETPVVAPFQESSRLRHGQLEERITHILQHYKKGVGHKRIKNDYLKLYGTFPPQSSYSLCMKKLRERGTTRKVWNNERIQLTQ